MQIVKLVNCNLWIIVNVIVNVNCFDGVNNVIRSGPPTTT